MNEGATAWLHHVSAPLCGCTATPAGEARPRLYQASASVRVSQGPRSRRTLGGRLCSCPPPSACPAGAPVTRTRTCPGTKERRRKGSGARPEVGKETRLVQDEVEAEWRGSQEGWKRGGVGDSREAPGAPWRPTGPRGFPKQYLQPRGPAGPLSLCCAGVCGGASPQTSPTGRGLLEPGPC